MIGPNPLFQIDITEQTAVASVDTARRCPAMFLPPSANHENPNTATNFGNLLVGDAQHNDAPQDKPPAKRACFPLSTVPSYS